MHRASFRLGACLALAVLAWAATMHASPASAKCSGLEISCVDAVHRYLHNAREAQRVLRAIEPPCKSGDLDACAALARFLQEGKRVTQDNARAFALLDAGCKQSHALSCAWLGRAYDHGAGTTKNPTRARELTTQSCDAGLMVGCFEEGWLSIDERRLPDAERLLKLACDGQNLDACFELAWQYGEGKIKPPHYDESGKILARACDRGSPVSCAKLGYNEDKIARDDAYKKAAVHFQRACDLGGGDACAELGTYYAFALGVARDFGKANALLTKACESGDDWGCYDLAESYAHARGVNEDRARAKALYQESCDLGLKIGCANPPGGRGLRLVSAVRWCGSGDGLACDRVGNVYEKGLEGEALDLDRAIVAFTDACAFGITHGCTELAVMQKTARAPTEIPWILPAKNTPAATAAPEPADAHPPFFSVAKECAPGSFCEEAPVFGRRYVMSAGAWRGGTYVATDDGTVFFWQNGRFTRSMHPLKTIASAWVSPSGALWVVGDGAAHSTGDAWKTESSDRFIAVWGSADNDLYAMSDSSLEHWDGRAFSAVQVPFIASAAPSIGTSPLSRNAGTGGLAGLGALSGIGASPLSAIWGTSRSDVWIVGGGGKIAHFDGAKWKETPSGTTKNLDFVGGSNARDVFAKGIETHGSDTGLETVRETVHWDGTSWSSWNQELYATAPPRSGPLGTWFPGEMGAQVWDGTSLAPHYFDNGDRTRIGGIVVDASGVLAFSQGRVDRADGNRWKPAWRDLHERWASVWQGAPNDAWVTGMNIARHWNGASWNAVDIPKGVDVIAGAAKDDAWGIGTIDPEKPTIAHLRASGWALMTCWACARAERLDGVFAIARDDVWAVGGNGVIVHYDGKSWTRRDTPTTEWLHRVWAPRAGDAWAVGAHGTILHNAGTTWTASHVDTNEIFWGVSGSGPSDVWAVGENGVIEHWDGRAWSKVASGVTDNLRQAVVVSPREVYFVSSVGRVLAFDGNAVKPLYSGDGSLWDGTRAADGRIWIVGENGQILRRN